MDAPRVFKHNDYELQCSAKALGSGRFVPCLVVARQAWPRRPRLIAMEPGDFLTEDGALEAAHAQGVAWVQHYG